MGYGRLWVKRGMGYKGFDCIVVANPGASADHMESVVAEVIALTLAGL